ncbi:hypothetical protein IFM89_039059 [Coptis chinensis]|uniref:ENTH domain-containing protein n=1 Tax=Coptis chinensis TaxID=261450 RepID=A0A835M6C7_9MAGN|nr:hypothetical protein IFM89_039059 [Coptis chinensis]
MLWNAYIYLPMALRKAIGAVKDQTTISIAKVSNSTSLSDLDVAIVKATRHEEYPADERYIREILSLTCYSRAHVSSCVNTISRRLNKTRNWTVALKTLMLIHRLLNDGDNAYEQEISFATRRGTRLLNMSDFRDSSQSGSWDYSAFVRTYALYLDERLEFKMYGRRGRHNGHRGDEEDEDGKMATTVPTGTPVREMKNEKIFTRTQHLQSLLERLLACRPTGDAKNNRVVLVALYPVMKESFQLYFDITEIMGILVDRFMELEVPDCGKVHEVFIRISKQFDELEHFYGWSKAVGVARSSDYPEVEKITQKKLEIMDEFIRDKSILAQSKKVPPKAPETQISDALHEEKTEEVVEEDMNAIKALPPPESFVEETEQKAEDKQEDITAEIIDAQNTQQQTDLLDLRDDNITSAYQGDTLALALFDGGSETVATKPAWEAFKPEDTPDWESALVETATNLSNQKASLGGGFDTLLLDGMYQQSTVAAAMAGSVGTGSASSVALGASGKPPMLALPAPPTSDGNAQLVNADPFAASLSVAPPSYVQMSDMEKKQKLLMDEQFMWQQYARNGLSNEADARNEQTNENDFNLFSGKLGGEDLDKNAIMFSMCFKTSNEAFEFYNEYAKVVGFSVRKGVYRFLKDIPVKRNFVCSCQGQSTNSKHVRKCARSADLNLRRGDTFYESGVCGFVATENSDKRKERSRISRCGNYSETGHTKTTCTWPKPQSQGLPSDYILTVPDHDVLHGPQTPHI